MWRIVVGISLIPAVATLYQRLTLPEALRFEKAAAGVPIEDEESLNKMESKSRVSANSSEADKAGKTGFDGEQVHAAGGSRGKSVLAQKREHWRGTSFFA